MTKRKTTVKASEYVGEEALVRVKVRGNMLVAQKVSGSGMNFCRLKGAQYYVRSKPFEQRGDRMVLLSDRTIYYEKREYTVVNKDEAHLPHEASFAFIQDGRCYYLVERDKNSESQYRKPESSMKSAKETAELISCVYDYYLKRGGSSYVITGTYRRKGGDNSAYLALKAKPRRDNHELIVKDNKAFTNSLNKKCERIGLPRPEVSKTVLECDFGSTVFHFHQYIFFGAKVEIDKLKALFDALWKKGDSFASELTAENTLYCFPSNYGDYEELNEIKRRVETGVVDEKAAFSIARKAAGKDDSRAKKIIEKVTMLYLYPAGKKFSITHGDKELVKSIREAMKGINMSGETFAALITEEPISRVDCPVRGSSGFTVATQTYYVAKPNAEGKKFIDAMNTFGS